MSGLEAKEFRIILVTPASLAHPNLAVAAARAGGVGVLDLEFSQPKDLPQAAQNLAQLLAAARPKEQLGLRLGIDQIAGAAELLTALAPRPHWLLVAVPETNRLAADLARLPAAKERRVLIEVNRVEAIVDPAGLSELVHGLIGRGSEAGGWVGPESAFILAQKLLRLDCHPVYLRGGLGPYTAAACRAGGAAGIVLDDQVWLLAESPLDPSWRAILTGLTGQEAIVLGRELGQGIRVLDRPDLAGARRLQALAAEMAKVSAEGQANWPQEAASLVGWGPPQEKAWPIGQGVGLAEDLAKRYRSVGRLIRAVSDQSRESLVLTEKLKLLEADSPLAQSHRTLYPLVQGPMAQVSDRPDFARLVAQAGGLPFLALSTLTGPQIKELLSQTAAAMGEAPWGVGLLGFLPAQTFQEQTSALKDNRPNFALIAGGRPDQATGLEASGTPTYLHVPTPGLLRLFLSEGASRFIFEGRESGGHVGPLSSFTLWESVVPVLVQEIPDSRAKQVHVLLAGGLHDARSAAMAATLAAPLDARGIKVGFQMGTAYLFCQEAVETGAIAPGFQAQALACQKTQILELGPGQANRVCPTPFAQTFQAARLRLLAEGAPAAKRRQALEELCRGRLKLAAKGLSRRGQEPAEEQFKEGMYLIGQAAGLRQETTSLASLHEEICQGGSALLARAREGLGPEEGLRAAKPADIAIIGLAAILPGSDGVEAYWRILLDKIEQIREIPAQRWDWRLYYDPSRRSPDLSASKWGGFIDPIEFDPVSFGIPPRSLNSISATQILALISVHRALTDAGYGGGGFNRERTAVIFAAADAGGMLNLHYTMRAALRLFAPGPHQESFTRLAEWSEESFAGILDNVVAGRVANRIDLGGPNFTVDAACASSLYALDAAVKELESGSSDLVIVGGVEASQTPVSYLSFSNTQALSPTGRARVFDQAADGTITAEGAAVAVLKRLADAERDGDKIYAVIRAVGCSSDGKALGLTAPLPAGQKRALDRAYQRAGLSPGTIGLMEAHGTGTPVGDLAECQTMTEILTEARAKPQSCVVGSSKSLIGHTKVAAGLAGLIKAALALYHQVLPPHGGIDKPFPLLTDPKSPLSLLSEAAPWLSRPAHPRRAGVSAFGFGGANAHAVLEEHRSPGRQAALGAQQWPSELILWRAADESGLAQAAAALNETLKAGAEPRLRDLAYSCALRAAQGGGDFHLGVVAENLDQLAAALGAAQAHLADPAQTLPPHVIIGRSDPKGPGQVAFVFPGQGAQHPGMARQAALYLAELREALQTADELLAGRFDGPLSSYIWPQATFSPEEEKHNQDRLKDCRAAQPAIGAVSAGFLDLMLRLGLEPDMVCGHSYGEYTALHAAGVLSRSDFLDLSEKRGRLMADACQVHGAMATVQASRKEVERLIEEFEGVVLANHNTPDQSVISGEQNQIRRIVDHLAEAGVRTILLPVAGAFHSHLMAPAQEALSRAIGAAALNPPQIPVFSSVTGRPYQASREAIQTVLDKQLLSPVEFVALIEKMYAKGARVFVELGPRSILCGLIDRILEGRDHLAVAAEGAGGGLRGLLIMLGRLIAAGLDLDPTALFAGRPVEPLDLGRLATTSRPARPQTTWLVDGDCAWPASQPTGRLGTAPLLTAKTAAEADKARSYPSFGLEPFHLDPALASELADQDKGLLKAYLDHQKTMRRFLEVEERVMRQVLSGQPPAAEPPLPYLAEAITPTEALLPLEAPAGIEDGERAEEGGLERTELIEALRQLISQRTGYPPEMLGPGLDLEAELGVDSIKRVEILGQLQRSLPLAQAEGVRERMETLSRAKSINALADIILLALPEAEGRPIEPPARPAEPEQRPAEVEPPPLVLAAEDGCPRFVMTPWAEAFPRIELSRPEGLFIITDGGAKISPAVEAELTRRGAKTALLGPKTLASAEKIFQAVDKLRQAHGPVRGVVHLAPLAARSAPESLAQWKDLTQQEVKSLFLILQAAAKDLTRSDLDRMGRVLAASRLGGLFGRGGRLGPGLPAAGGCQGLLKTIGREWFRVLPKALDFDDQIAPADLARIVAEELLLPGGQIEVGYPGGERTIFIPLCRPIEAGAKAVRPEEDWVVLITGGARGITARAAAALIRPGMRLIIVGQSTLPPPEPAHTAEIADPNQLRRRLIEQTRRQGKAKTPAQIEAQLAALIQGRQRQANLAGFREMGAGVEYRSVDVRDEAAFSVLIEEIYRRFGRLDAVIHGAGVIADKLLTDKAPASFDRVFGTKADSAFLLSRHLRPDSLKLLVLFASTAGLFGNRGQSDYSAANEVLNRMAWYLAERWPLTRVAAINWGPWDKTGLASPEVNRRFLAQGYLPIQPEAGGRFFLEEILYGPRQEVEVVAGLGPWDQEYTQRLAEAAWASPI